MRWVAIGRSKMGRKAGGREREESKMARVAAEKSSLAIVTEVRRGGKEGKQVR